MISTLDIKAYVLQIFFNFWGHLGRLVLNYGVMKDREVLRDLPYGPDPRQRLDIFRSKNSESSTLTVLVYFHGGGWISADKRIYDGICATLSRYGCLTVNVNYRLAPAKRFPSQLRDAAQAVAWVHDNAAHYGGDPAKIVLAGDSAGAQLASWYASALHNESLLASTGIDRRLSTRCLKGLLLFYGVYDFATVLDAPFPFIRIYAKSFLGAEPTEYAENSELASPIKHVTGRLPSVFLCAGKRDGLYRQTVDYADALTKCGVRCRTLLLSKAHRAGHGFLFFSRRKAARLAFAAAREFLQELD